MARVVLSISISEELDERMLMHWTDAGYTSASEYVRELIRNDLRQNAKDQAPFTHPKARARGVRSRWDR